VDDIDFAERARELDALREQERTRPEKRGPWAAAVSPACRVSAEAEHALIALWQSALTEWLAGASFGLSLARLMICRDEMDVLRGVVPVKKGRAEGVSMRRWDEAVQLVGVRIDRHWIGPRDHRTAYLVGPWKGWAPGPDDLWRVPVGPSTRSVAFADALALVCAGVRPC